MKQYSEKGFTFLELLLVLSVVSILTAIVMPIGNKWAQATSEEEAIQLLTSTIYSMQSYAIAHKETTRVHFKRIDNQTKYIADRVGKGIISETYLPESMRVSSSSSLKEIIFAANGDIVNFGTLTFLTNTGTISIKFQFQHGRMIISESEGLLLAGNHSHAFGNRRYLWNASTDRNKIDFGITGEKVGHARG